MKVKGLVSGVVAAAMLSGCASMEGVDGPRGPRIVGSSRSTEYEQYAEIGVEFSSVGDFFALVSPKRWKSPVATGGSLSWINPMAWSDDPGRTGRIFLGEAVVVGGAVAAISGGGGGGSGSSDGGTTSASGPSTPPPSLPPAPPPG